MYTLEENNIPKITINNKTYILSNLERYINYTILRIDSSRKIKDFNNFNLKCNKDLLSFNINPTNGYNYFIKVFKELKIIELSDNDYEYEKKHKTKRYKFNFASFENLIIDVFSSETEINYYDFGKLENLFFNNSIPDDFKSLMKIYKEKEMKNYVNFITRNNRILDRVDSQRFNRFWSYKININRPKSNGIYPTAF